MAGMVSRAFDLNRTGVIWKSLQKALKQQLRKAIEIVGL
jgi:hypothetical protein